MNNRYSDQEMIELFTEAGCEQWRTMSDFEIIMKSPCGTMIQIHQLRFARRDIIDATCDYIKENKCLPVFELVDDIAKIITD